jgi:hypothetical protein
MTPEDIFHGLNVQGCTWESLGRIDYEELVQIMKKLKTENNWSTVDLCAILELRRLSQLETSELFLEWVVQLSLVINSIVHAVIENLCPGDVQRAELLTDIEETMDMYGWSATPLEKYEELCQKHGMRRRL